MSSSKCCFLTYIQVFRRQVRWSGILISWRIFQFVIIHTVEVLVLSEAEVDVFLEFSCFFDDPMDDGNLISCSSAFPKYSLYIWEFLVHVLLKPGLENFEHYFASMWYECNYVLVWTFFGIAFSASLEIIKWFLSFNLLIWCITLIDVHILKNPCIPGINPTWWCMSFLMCCWILFAKTLWRTFASMFISDIGL